LRRHDGYNDNQMKPQSNILIFTLASLAALAPFAIDTYLPAFHEMGVDLSATDLQIQQSLAVYLLPYAIMTLWHGAISDSIGRIATIKWGLGIFVLASIGCAFAPNVETLWFFRALQGASGGAGNTVARAMVRDLFEGAQAQRVMATVQMLFGIAPAVAPMIGGLLLGFSWQSIFVFLAIYAAISLWAAVKYLPETMPPEKRLKLSTHNVLTSYKTIFSDSEYAKLCIALGAVFAAFFVYVLASPIFLGKLLGFSPQEYSYLFVPTVCGMVLGSYLARHAAGKYAAKRVLRVAYAWMFAIVLLNLALTYALPANPVLNILPIALFNIGMGLVMPIISLAALDRHPKIRGTAASGQAFVQMLLSTISAGIIVPLVWSSVFGMASAMLVFWLISWLAIRQTKLCA
jgi:MFS transporter, DHA1 family, multidrug resistance protein